MRWACLAVLSLAVAAASVGCSEDDPMRPSVFPTADEFSHEVASSWAALYLELCQNTPGYSPPVVSRALGYSGVTLYETVVPGMPGYQTLAGQLNGLGALPAPDHGTEYHWPAAANAALERITELLFPGASEAHRDSIAQLAADFHESFHGEVSEDVIERSEAWGVEVADAVYNWSITDGGHGGHTGNFPADYVAPAGPGLWVPTPQLNGSDPQPIPLQPYWGENRPFVLPAGGNPNEDCHPGYFPDYSTDPSSDFYDEAAEVYTTVNNITAEQEEIALFWADDPGATATPPGHSCAVLNQVLEAEDASLALAAEAYAKVGIAVADAFIACWHTKYETNLLRPITYIRENFAGAEDWMTFVNTPPFPEYTSGHSVQSGAAFQVMTDLFGENYAYTDRFHLNRAGTERSFASFSAAADEAAISRLYGGIHYRSAIALGVEQGQCIGNQVSALAFQAVP
jgi:hypothetical protein